MCRFWLLSCMAATLGFATALGSVLLLRAQESGEQRATGLMYHRFVTDDEFARLSEKDRLYAVPVGHFEEHLRFLQREGYHAISIEDCIAFAKGKKALPGKSVVITIDDGYRSTLTRAEPILRKYGFRAVLFVTAAPHADIFSEVGESRLTGEELASLDPRFFDIGAHGISHRPLSEMGDGELRAELVGSKAIIAGFVKRPVNAMAVPSNRYDDRVVRWAKEVSFDAVFTSDPGSIQAGSDLHRLPRFNVAGHLDETGLARLLDPANVAHRRFSWACSRAPRALFGTDLGAPIGRLLSSALSGPRLSARNAVLASIVLIALWMLPLIRRLRIKSTAR